MSLSPASLVSSRSFGLVQRLHHRRRTNRASPGLPAHLQHRTLVTTHTGPNLHTFSVSNLHFVSSSFPHTLPRQKAGIALAVVAPNIANQPVVARFSYGCRLPQ